MHEETLHGRVRLTMNLVRERYWIINLRRPVKKRILKFAISLKVSQVQKAEWRRTKFWFWRAISAQSSELLTTLTDQMGSENCLKGHPGKCSSRPGCQRCGRYHHTLLHVERQPTNVPTPAPVSSNDNNRSGRGTQVESKNHHKNVDFTRSPRSPLLDQASKAS